MFAERGIRTLPRPAGAPGRSATAARCSTPTCAHRRHLHLAHLGHRAWAPTGATTIPQLEPIVEIYQGDRTNYEHRGAPQSGRRKSDLVHGGYKPEGFVWNALAKGYRLGFQASSDHISTHISYAMRLADGPHRKAILDAFKQRHCYGATDNIVLDVRMGDHLMGDDFASPRPLPLAVRVFGTAPIRQVDVISNQKYVYTTRAQQTRGRPPLPRHRPHPGLRYYYVRVEQTDGQLAWASPLWLRLPLILNTVFPYP